MKIKLSKFMAEELLFKLEVVKDNDELLEGSDITMSEIFALYDSIPSKGGEWNCPEKVIEFLKDEMQDYPRFEKLFLPKVKDSITNRSMTVKNLGHILFEENDGGRALAGYKGDAGDCVTRAISIATGNPYKEVYDSLNELSKNERIGKRKKKISSARTGVYRQTAEKYLKSLGWKFVAVSGIGTGCKMHLKTEELPSGTIIVRLSKHFACVKDGVLNDTYDCSRNGTRCVYGYYIKV